MTSTEISTAYREGIDIVKTFLANIMDPRYLKDIYGPLPYVQLMLTDRVNLNNNCEYSKMERGLPVSEIHMSIRNNPLMIRL